MKIIQTARFKVVKPVDGDWDHLGRIFHALRTPLHRILNGIVTELALAERRRAAHGEFIAHPHTLSYQLASDFWDRELEAAQARITKGKPLNGDKAIAAHEPGSSLKRGVGNAAYARWAKWRQESWSGDSSLPSFRKRGPIYISSDGVEIMAQDGDAILRLRLLAGRDGWYGMIILPYGQHGHADLRRMLGGAKVGDARLVQDKRDGSWQALVSYTYEVTEAEQGATMALHRGISTFLAAAVARHGPREAYTTILETGADILRHKQAYQARRRSLGQQLRQIGAGARGHGHDRRYEHIERLEGAEKRWVRTKCQEVAAHAIKLALRKHVSRILLEEWTNPAKHGAPTLSTEAEYLVRSWPFAQLREMIEWAAKRHGLTVEIVKTDGNSRTCPHCGHMHEIAQVGTFLCERCRLKRPADVVFPWLMLVRDGQPNPFPDALAREKRQRGMLRKALKSSTHPPTEPS